MNAKMANEVTCLNHHVYERALSKFFLVLTLLHFTHRMSKWVCDLREQFNRIHIQMWICVIHKHKSMRECMTPHLCIFLCVCLTAWKGTLSPSLLRNKTKSSSVLSQLEVILRPLWAPHLLLPSSKLLCSVLLIRLIMWKSGRTENLSLFNF